MIGVCSRVTCEYFVGYSYCKAESCPYTTNPSYKQTAVSLGKKPQTNADRIRAMTDEELAEWIANELFEDNNSGFLLDWLKKEVEDG